MKLDLHIHTNHSFDCQADVAAVVKSAEKAGLSAIAITDHDNMSAYGIAKKKSKSVTIIPAMEITTEQGTHIVGLFINDEIISKDILEAIDEIHDQGGLVMIPHPFHKCTGFLSGRFNEQIYNGETFERILSQVDIFEAFTYGADAEDLVDTDKFLKVHPEIVQISSSNAHRPEDIGRAHVELEKAKSSDLHDIKQALIKSPRLLRYEAYSIDDRKAIPETRHIEGKNGLLKKIADSTVRPMVNSIRNLYRRNENSDGE